MRDRASSTVRVCCHAARDAAPASRRAMASARSSCAFAPGSSGGRPGWSAAMLPRTASVRSAGRPVGAGVPGPAPAAGRQEASTLLTDEGVGAPCASRRPGVGCLLAAAGPRSCLLGAPHDATDGWTAPMPLLAALCVPMGIAGVGGGRDRRLDDEHTAHTLTAGAPSPSGQENAPSSGRCPRTRGFARATRAARTMSASVSARAHGGRGEGVRCSRFATSCPRCARQPRGRRRSPGPRFPSGPRTDSRTDARTDARTDRDSENVHNRPFPPAGTSSTTPTSTSSAR